LQKIAEIPKISKQAI